MAASDFTVFVIDGGATVRASTAALVSGVPNKTIARELGVCHRTAAHIRANLFEKMGVESVVDLAVMANDLQRLDRKGAMTYANVFGQFDIPQYAN